MKIPKVVAGCIIGAALFLVGLLAWVVSRADTNATLPPSSMPQFVQPQTTEIKGQIFVVTEGGENIPLGDVKVALLHKTETLAYFNTYALEWSKELENNWTNISQATDHFALHYAIEEVSSAWNFINFPSADELEQITGFDYAGSTKKEQITTTDADGRFKFIVPTTAMDWILAAKAERGVGDKKEQYWWLVDLGFNGESKEVILSNDNMNQRGIAAFLDNTNIAAYFSDYGVKLQEISEREKTEKDK